VGFLSEQMSCIYFYFPFFFLDEKEEIPTMNVGTRLCLLRSMPE
jgi:hypothetical protein